MSEKYLYELELTDDWLERLNEEFRKKDIPHKQRPWEAMIEWANYSGDVFSFNDEIGKRIFSWFEKNTKAGSQQFGSMYVGSFYYDSCFWPVLVPVVYGTVKLDAISSLRTMSDSIKSRLMKDRNEFTQFVFFWADCIDYGFGIEGLSKNKTIGSFGQELFSSANQQLTATVTLLHEENPNPKAVESARMATEMFLKALLASKTGLTEHDAQFKIRHDLDKALNMWLDVDNTSELQNIRASLNCFPNVGERYKGTTKSPRELWESYRVAQFTGTTIVRLLTGRDSRKSIRIDDLATVAERHDEPTISHDELLNELNRDGLA